MPTQVSLLDGALASAGTLAIQTNGTTSAITISSAQVATFVNNPIMTGLTASRAVFTDGSKGLTSNAITGTGNVVMSASPTLTGTIDGAALTLSSSLTLSGGTANGVLYLNGSKVATSGSVLTFDGSYLNLSRGSSGTLLNLTDAVAQTFRVATTASTVNLDSASGGSLAFLIGSSEQMRLTSTGLGIGTSSPSYKLDVVANQNASTISSVSNSTSGTAAYAALRISSDTNSWLYNFSSGYTTSGRFAAGTTLLDVGGSNGLGLSTSGSAPIIFYTVGSERMRLDSSGNLGLGVTPSAGYRASIKGDYSSIVGGIEFDNGGGDKTVVGFASATSPSFIISNQSASGVLRFDTNNTERMRLDSSGNLGIGTSSPNSLLTVQNGNILLRSAVTTGALSSYNLGFSATATGGAAAYITSYRENANEASALVFGTWNGSASAERARITSGGDFVVGKTATGVGTQGFGVYSTGDFEANAGTNPAGYLNRTNDGTILSIRRSGTTVGTISVTTTATAYNTSSDYRLKENIQPMTGALAKVTALKPCTYNWKADGSAGEGFIAHELAEVMPQAVTGQKDAVDAEGNPVYQGIDTSFLVATLTAAIKELKAEFDAYKATHP